MSVPDQAPAAARRPRRGGRRLIWLCGAALALNLLLVLAQLALIAWNGLAYFWPRDLQAWRLDDGTVHLGELHASEPFQPPGGGPEERRIQVKVANRERTGTDFLWIEERRIAAVERPADAVHVERLEWGSFHGFLAEVRDGERTLAAGDPAWPALLALLERKAQQRERIAAIEQGELDDINHELERIRLARRRIELEAPAGAASGLARLAEEEAALRARFDVLAAELAALRDELTRERVAFTLAGGGSAEFAASELLHALRPNAMSTAAKLGTWAVRIGRFLVDDPRESNTEGGIFPALFGTVLMVFLMSLAVVPLGVLAALYLREYSKQGALVRCVRIAVNNLAGVPSIVFGVFGLGFFVYGIGGTIDRLFYPEALPSATFGTGGILWAALTLALLTVPVVIVATEEGLAAVPRAVREGSLALGATKFETTWRVVLPAAAPGMLTGVILAIARAAGEVAPLMIVGMVKLAPALPVDHHPPFFHVERKFMHLGFHIFDVGFQSPNVEATSPLVFATALVLLALVVAMNLIAISLRNKLRKRYSLSAV